jgi:ketosteroid isomerase-like protein
MKFIYTNKMKSILTLWASFILLSLIYSCTRPGPQLPDKEQLMLADRQFSEYSVNNGMKKAFSAFADSSVVLLRANSMPIEGGNALSERMSNIPDTLFTLSWEPINGEIAGSGDLGFTYGVYTSTPRDTSVGQKAEQGTYVTIWKKQADGSWKYVLDTGNEGVRHE